MREAEIIELAIRRIADNMAKYANVDSKEERIAGALQMVADEIAKLCKIYKEEKK
jgi:hypothetical protein